MKKKKEKENKDKISEKDIPEIINKGNVDEFIKYFPEHLRPQILLELVNYFIRHAEEGKDLDCIK